MAPKKGQRAMALVSGGTLHLNRVVYGPGDEVDQKAVDSLPTEERERLFETGALVEELARPAEPDAGGEGDE